MPNLRDVGGYLAGDGHRVRTGLLYRSSALNHLAGGDAATFGQLGIRTVYDLRSHLERQSQPEQLPAGTKYVTADVIGDAMRGSFAQLMEVVSNPELAWELLGEGRGVSMWTELYRDFVRLDSARAAYKKGKLAMEQYLLTLKKLEQTIMATIDDDIKQAQSSYQQVAATRAAREYATDALDAEQKKLESGKSTTYTVLQMQRDLTTARGNEIQALAAYNKALAQLSLDEGSTLQRLSISLEVK